MRRRWQKGSLRIRGEYWELRFRIDVINPSTGLVQRAERTQRLGPSTRSRKWAEDAAKRLIHSIDPPAETAGKTSSAAAAIDRYERDHLILVKHSSQTSYRSIIRHHLRPALQGLPLARLDTAAVQSRLITIMVKANLKRSTIEGAVVLLIRILKVAQRAGFSIGRFDAHQLVLPVKDLATERVYSPDEAHAILNAELKPQQKAFFGVLLLTGLRVSEVLGLEWNDVDLKGRTLHVRRSSVSARLGITKTRITAAPRAVSAQLAMRLEQWRAASPVTASGLVFHTSTDRPIWRSHVHRSWLTPLCKRLGIARRGIHALRHAFGHAAGALGSATSVRDLLRHSSISTSDIYLRGVATDLVRINQAISDRLCGGEKSGNEASAIASELRTLRGPEPEITAVSDK